MPNVLVVRDESRKRLRQQVDLYNYLTRLNRVSKQERKNHGLYKSNRKDAAERPRIFISTLPIRLDAMKGKGVREKKSSKKKDTRRRLRLPKDVPKPIVEKVEEAEKPEDVIIIQPSPKDPVVYVKGRVVGAWADL